jgi:hypothetical protein
LYIRVEDILTSQDTAVDLTIKLVSGALECIIMFVQNHASLGERNFEFPGVDFVEYAQLLFLSCIVVRDLQHRNFLWVIIHRLAMMYTISAMVGCSLTGLPHLVIVNSFAHASLFHAIPPPLHGLRSRFLLHSLYPASYPYVAFVYYRYYTGTRGAGTDETAVRRAVELRDQFNVEGDDEVPGSDGRATGVSAAQPEYEEGTDSDEGLDTEDGE